MAGPTPATIPLLVRPRATMRWILHEDPNYGVMMIALLAGITTFLRSSALHGLHPLPGLMGLDPWLDKVITYGIGATPSIPMLTLSIFLVGSLFGVIAVYLEGLLLWLVGLVAGGRGRYEETRSALAWAFVPYIWLLPLWLGLVLWLGEDLRQGGFTYQAYISAGAPWPLVALTVLDYAARIVCLILLVLKLTVTLRFSIWKAIIVVAVGLAPLLYLIPNLHTLGF